jgi:hypothetical protein
MARRDDLATLGAVLEIRIAQAAAAAADVARAQQVSAQAQARLDEARDLQAARGEAWTAIVSSARLDLTLSRVWAAAVVDGEDQVDLASQSSTRADDLWAEARGEARDAEARRAGAETLAKAAVRRRRRWIDEAAVAVAEDLFLQRRFVA